jgi:hypothetical protein
MTLVTVEALKALSIAWAGARGAGFAYNFPVKGGWEGWCQVDLVAFVLARDSTYDIVREQPNVLDAGQRVDLLANAQQQPEEQVIVEMKAESLSNQAAFVGGVSSDVDKLSNGRRQPWQRSRCAVLAIAFSPQGVRGVEDIARGVRIFSRIAQGAQGEFALLMTAWEARGGWMPV